jgi:starch synthase (maltosyl-transferring)
MREGEGPGGGMPAAAISPACFPPVLIERVAPELDGGRHPVKRLVGDLLHVSADVLKDGHDVLAACICYRGPGDAAWRFAPMTYDYNDDRWAGAFPLDRVGRWHYSVEGWADPFATWRADLETRVQNDMSVDAELLGGATLVEAAARRAHGADRAALARAAALLAARDALVLARARVALGAELQALMSVHGMPGERTRYARELEVVVDRVRAGFAAWYEMFPRSQGAVPGIHATFADAARRLPRLAELGFDVVYLPPIHPIGRSHRKGANNTLEAGPGDPGSPWAIGNEHGGFTAVEPALGTLADFERFVARAATLGMEVALDYALQCSPDHPWVREHPEWFFVRPDGSIKYAENPPKKYQDIYPLNFWCADHERLWQACRDVLLHWIEHGVRIFRVDNPHTKPLSFWEWVIAEVQRDHPDVIFLAEAFTRPKRMQALAKLGFTQSYTYFTWRNTASELREYLTELTQTEMAEYFRGNFFTNTPDILHEYLQRGGRPAFRVRLLLAATLSPLYGIYSGFELAENVALRPGSEEYLHSEKYEIRVRDWEAPGNLNADIQTLNRIRRESPALQPSGTLTFHLSENDQVLFYRRSAPDGSNDLLIAVNLDPHLAQATMVHVPLAALGLAAEQTFAVRDLLTGARYTWQGARNYVRLDPAEQVGHVLLVERG